MYCKYISKCLNGKIRCKKHKVYIIYPFDCQNCSDFIFKTNKPIKNKTNKKKQLENNRYSIFTNDFSRCFKCKRKFDRLDLHEVYGGSNRKRSILNGFVVPLCRECHSNEEIIKELRIILQKEYEKEHSREDFIKIIGKNYIKEV